MATRTLSPLMKKYNALRKAKRLNCEGKKTKTDVKKVADAYIAAAIKKGQDKKEAEKKARAVMNGGCKMSSRVTGTKKTKSTTRRRK